MSRQSPAALDQQIGPIGADVRHPPAYRYGLLDYGADSS